MDRKTGLKAPYRARFRMLRPMFVFSGTPRRAFLGRCVISLGVATSLMVAGVAAVNHGIDHRIGEIHRIALREAQPPPQGANFLIIGSDTRTFAGQSGDVGGFGDPSIDPNAQGQRSDTLMVAHVEPGSQRTLVVSFPRDLWVDIPGLQGKHKINAAYDANGAQGVIDTLKVNFGIDIHHYMQVDFESFQAVVKTIGNVKVSFPYPARDTQVGLTALVAGCYPLDGPSALAYVRSRYLEYYINGQWQYVGQDAPDLHRIERQQKFIKKLTGLAIEKSLSDPLLGKDIADSALSYLKADSGLSRGDVNRLINAFRTVNVNDQGSLQFETVPVVPSISGDGQDILTLGAGAEQMIAQLRTFGDNRPQPVTVEPSAVTVRVVDASGKGIGDGVSTELTKQGFRATSTGARTTHVKVSEIRYAPDQSEEAKALLAYVPDAKLVPDSRATGKVRLALGDSFQAITVPTTTTLAPSSSAVTLPKTPTTRPKHVPTTTTVSASQDCS